MTDPRRVLILGSTGSIGTQALDVIAAHPDDFDVVLVHIRSGALEDALEALLGRPVRRPLPLPATVPLESAAGRALAATIGLAVPKGEIDGRCLDLNPGDGTTCR